MNNLSNPVPIRKFALITKFTIGDGIISMIYAYQYYKLGYKVTVYNSLLEDLKDWFFPCTFKTLPQNSDLEKQLKDFDDVIIMEHKADYVKYLKNLREKSSHPPMRFIHATLHHNLHPFLHPNDIAYDAKTSMVKNSFHTLQRLFPDTNTSSHNGITPPKNLIHRKYRRRIVLHPSSNTPSKNWPKKRYFKLALKLQKLSFEPVICVAPHEYKQYKNPDLKVVSFPSLNELASFIYESGYVIGNDSGLVHLASNLQIPSITIAGSPRIMQLWKADWLPTHLICGPKYLINPKGLRLRDRFWGRCISVRSVLRLFYLLKS